VLIVGPEREHAIWQREHTAHATARCWGPAVPGGRQAHRPAATTIVGPQDARRSWLVSIGSKNPDPQGPVADRQTASSTAAELSHLVLVVGLEAIVAEAKDSVAAKHPSGCLGFEV